MTCLKSSCQVRTGQTQGSCFLPPFPTTLPAEMFGVTDFWLETRVIIKIFKKMIPGMKTKVVFIEKHPKIFFLNQNGRQIKIEIFNWVWSLG